MMTEENEPIIIDGVNVNGCEFCKRICTNTEEPMVICSLNVYCKSSTNCHFKQLARKTQECDYWKHQAELGSETTDRLAKQLEEKEQECEELKNNLNIEHAELLNARSEIERLKKQIESDKGLITNAGKQYYQLVQEYDRLKTENEQAEQKLERIKEICKTKQKQSVYVLPSIWEQILQIIDEVE